MAASSDKPSAVPAGNTGAIRSRWTDWIKDNAAPFAIMLGLIGTVIGGFLWVEARYAKAEQISLLDRRFHTKLTQLECRFEIRFSSDYIQATNKRIWQLQDRLATNPNDRTAKEELRMLEEKKAKLVRDLERIERSCSKSG